MRVWRRFASSCSRRARSPHHARRSSAATSTPPRTPTRSARCSVTTPRPARAPQHADEGLETHKCHTTHTGVIALISDSPHKPHEPRRLLPRHPPRNRRAPVPRAACGLTRARRRQGSAARRRDGLPRRAGACWRRPRCRAAPRVRAPACTRDGARGAARHLRCGFSLACPSF
jgi:hypothetical protein